MKKNYLILLLVFVMSNLFAQNSEVFNTGGVIIADEFHITRPLSEIAREFPVDDNKFYGKKESGDRKHRKAQQFPKTVADGPEYGNDPSVMQTQMGTIPGRAPIANWAGQTASGFRPYDPSGAPGPNHYIQMINSTTFKVYNKSTGAVLLTATLGNLWSPVTGNNGDPIVMYDKAADRWFLAQFGSSTDKKIYIAVSTTSDPLGSYYTYTYTSPLFPDYLKFGVWSDGYYMTSNQSTQKVFAFDRDAILAGTAGAKSIYINFTPPKSGFFCPLPGDAADGTLPPSGTPCPIFSYSDNGWGGSYVDAINIYQMSVNWVPTTPTGSITLKANLSPAAFDASYDSNWDDVDQPGTTQKLDGIGGVFMYRAQWRSWDGYNTILLNWGVKVGTTQRSIKWVELRQDQTSTTWSIYQEGVYTPDAATRWMGGIAMDVNGSIGLSYMKSDATSIYPGLYYTGRRSCDPLGTLPITETLAIVGTAYQTGTNRVGDYAQTSLDPDGITFWHTSEYMGGSSGGSAARTRIFSYQLPNCGNTAVVNISVTSGSNPTCTGNSITFTASPTNGGTTPVYQWKVNGTNVGTNSATYTTSSLSNGQVVTCVMTSNLPGVIGSPATSNSITITVSPAVTPSVSIALTTGTNPSCAGTALTFTASPTNGGTTPSYQWKLNGTNVGTNSSTYTSSTITNGQTVSCVMTTNANCATTSTATSNGISLTIDAIINPTVSISQTSGTNPLCNGASATFTATVSNGTGTDYFWKVDGTSVGTNSSVFTTSSLADGDLVTCEISSTPNCAATQSVVLGTGTGTNGTTSDLAAAYPSYYGSGRQQYLILATELSALSLSAGDINSIGFTINGTLGDPATLNDYTIKFANTTSTFLTLAFQNPAFTTVFGPVNYTPTLSSLNTHVFSSPYNWDGVSNILIDICFSNLVVGVTAYQNYQTSTGFVSTVYRQVDGSGGAGVCTTATTTNTGSIRPNMVFSRIGSVVNASSNSIAMTVGSSFPASVSIAQTTGSNPQCAGASATFTATPTNGGTTPSYQWKVNGTNVGTNSTTYTTTTLTNGQAITCVMTSNAACVSGSPATSNSISMTVNSNVAASVLIALTSGTNPMCSGVSATFTATPTNGGTTPSYQWKVNGTNVGTNSTTYTTTTLTNGQAITCVMTSNASCVSGSPATSNSISMTVNANVTASVSIALTSGTNPMCSGASATFTATPTNGGTTPSYQWKVNGTNVGTNSATYTTTTLTNGQAVTCVMTSNASCVSGSPATSNSISMTVNANVTASVSIALTSGTNPMCSGASATFTATPTNGGTTPSYQWKVNGTNVGTNSATYTSTTLTNGQAVTCVMTSNASCVTGSPATSNSISMTVNSNVTASVSIALTSGTNPMCSGASATFTATPTNGGTTPSYQWKVNGTNVGTNSATYTTTTLTNGQAVTCVMTSNASCVTGSPATSNSISMTVNANVTASVLIALTSGTNPQCSGASATFTATPTNGGTTPSYQWKVNGTNVGTNSATYTSTTLTNGQAVTCVMTSNASCATGSPATSNSISMNVNSNVTASAVITLTGGTNPQCAGALVTFSVTPTNGGSNPTYQWKVNGTNVGVNGATHSTNTITNGQAVTCVMTSDAACVSGNPATSNSITMTVNSPPAISSFTPMGGGAGTSVTILGSGFISVSSVKFNGVSSSYTVNSANQITATAPVGVSTGLISVTTPCGTANSAANFNGTVTLNVKVFIEGFYTGGGQMTGVLSPTVCDTITVSLANTVSPYLIDYTVKGTINRSGDGTFNFPGAAFGKTYYVIINHRNTLETWSGAPVSLPAAINSYSFTTGLSQAFGNNMVGIGGVFAIISGDVNQDGLINLSDVLAMENSLLLMTMGYYPYDLTGDNLVEAADFSLIENNIGKSKNRP